MKAQSIQQFAIVSADSAPAFEEQLNARIRQLSGKNPQVKFDGFTAYITYIETTLIPETTADLYELQGVNFRCEDCPAFQPILNADGTEDRRRKYGECEFAREYGRTYKDSQCCEHLFEMIRDGRVGLCWSR